MNNLQIIREAVIKAVPDILKLEFGCEVDRGAKIKSKEVVVGFFGEEIALVRRHPTNGDYLPFEVPIELKNTWKILGRPIRLADVLYAIERNHRHVDLLILANSLHIGKYGDGRNKEGYYSHILWNLLKDDLSLQSPETLEFLADLLKEDNKNI